MAPTLPAGYVVRPPTMADAEAVAALYNACSMVDLGVSETAVADIQRDWHTPGFELARDAWIVTTPAGHTVGYTEAWSPAPFTGIYCIGRVEPAEQGHGIGTYLLRVEEERARQIMTEAPAESRIALVHRTLNTNERAARLFQRAGFQLDRCSWRMTIALDDAPPAPVWPNGLTVRAASTGLDERHAYEAIEEAFHDAYDHQPTPFATWLHWQTSDPQTYDPSLWFLALDGAEVAGAVVCRPHLSGYAGLGWVDDLGVRRAWRRRGLGMALLRHAFGAFYERGVRNVGLNVDASSPTGAMRLYERAGMRVVRQYDRYVKELRAGDASSHERRS